MKENNFNGLTIASKKRRFVVFIINFAFTMVLLFTFQYLIWQKSFEEFFFEGAFFEIVLQDAIASAILGIIFYPILSGTLGHRLLNVKVVDEEGKEVKEWRIGAVREFVKGMFINLLLPIFWIFFDPKNQNIYDKIFDTYVVMRNSENKH